MTRLKFKWLVCSGHHSGMQGLKILGLKVAQIICSSGPFPGEGAVHESLVLGIEWNIVVFLFVFHVGIL